MIINTTSCTGCPLQSTRFRKSLNQPYVISGDRTMRGAVKIFDEIRRGKLNIGVAGIPKTVENDIGIIDRSFGFQTAVEMAQDAINAAHVEAMSAVNGIVLVKLMGRNTGHISLHKTVSSRDVGCLNFLRSGLKKTGKQYWFVAEGAGQDLIPRNDAPKEERDESGSRVFLDAGVQTKNHPNELFPVKYIDPKFMIHAVPAMLLTICIVPFWLTLQFMELWLVTLDLYPVPLMATMHTSPL